jgi:hypothetical protein
MGMVTGNDLERSGGDLFQDKLYPVTSLGGSKGCEMFRIPHCPETIVLQIAVSL